MATGAAEVFEQDRPNFTAELIGGRFRWDLMRSWPVRAEPDRQAGQAAAQRLTELLRQRPDATVADLLPDLKRQGFLALGTAAAHGGLGLDPAGIFDVIEAAARVSLPVALTLAVEAAIGVGAYLPALPDGPLRELIEAYVRQGVVSGTADTEPAGAANRIRYTTATAAEDDKAYLLNGEKLFTGNAPVADLLWTTATVSEPDRDRVRTFLVDPHAPGVEIGEHTFMGVNGFPNGWIRFSDVTVPAEHMFADDGDYAGRITPTLTVMLAMGRVYLICAPALAIARNCAEAVRDFTVRRHVDARRVADFPAIQRLTAVTLAEIFAIESVVQWSVLSGAHLGVNSLLEQNLAKNICSLACWEIADRALSVLAAEGYETAASKRLRGAAAVPLEQHFRDARNLRVSGGVDFLLDYWFSQMIVFAGPHVLASPDPAPAPAVDPGRLNARNAAHLHELANQIHRYGNTCTELAAQISAEQQQIHIAIGAICRELVAMAATLAHAQSLAAQSAQELADVYCTEARRRLTGWWSRLSEVDEPDYARVSRGWLEQE